MYSVTHRVPKLQYFDKSYVPGGTAVIVYNLLETAIDNAISFKSTL